MKKSFIPLLSLAVSGGVVAQDEHSQALDAMVISASHIEQKITEAPASITVVSKEELDKKPYLTLLDAVREAEGVDVGETTDKTGQGGISIRGMGADYTLILVDGKRQNNVGDIYPNNFGGNQFNHIPPKEMIERIEIIRGPASTLYGSEALGGVINIITKKVGTAWHGSLSQSQTFETDDNYGNDRTTEFVVNGPLVKGKLGINLRGSLYSRDASSPQFTAELDPNGNAVPRDLGYGSGGRTVDNENTNLGARLDYRVNDTHELTFDYETSHQKYDNEPVDGANPLGTTDSVDRLPRAGYAEKQEFSRDQFSIRHEAAWGKVNSDVTLHYINTSNDGRTRPLTANERLEYNQLVADGATDEEIEAAFLPRPPRALETRQTTLDVKFDSSFGNHVVVYGVQYIDAEMEDGTFGMSGSDFDDGVTQAHRQWAIFAEDNWDLSDDLTATAGLRYDHHNVFSGNVSPRVYANYTMSETWVVKGGISTGYKAPQANDLFDGIIGFGGQGTRPFVGTPELSPETSVSSEIAFYYSHENGHNFNLTIFSNQFKDKIETGGSILHCDDPSAVASNCIALAAEWNEVLGDGYSFSQLENIDRAEINGVELAGRFFLNDVMSLGGNYTFTDAEIKSGANKGEPLSGTAKHMANATFDWQLTDIINSYLTAEYRSDRNTSKPSSFPSDIDYPEYYQSYTTFHLGARFDVSEQLEINTRVNNLFDKDFTTYQTVFTTEDGGTSYEPNYIDDYNVKAKARNFWLSATYKF